MMKKLKRSIQFFIREIFSTSNYLLYLIAKTRGYENLLVNPGTMICIEGYPRSANTRASAIAMQFYDESNIARHTHSIGQLKKALKDNVDIYFIVREPSAAIASNKIRNENIYLKLLMWQYKRIYEYVIKNKDRINIVKFESVVSDEFLSDLYVKYSKQYNQMEIDQKVEDMEIADSGGIVRETHVARPSNERKSKALLIVERIKMDREYNKLLALYEYSKI